MRARSAPVSVLTAGGGCRGAGGRRRVRALANERESVELLAPDATHGNGFRLFERVSQAVRLPPVASGCDR
jgi:hypothetical protein